MEPRQSAEISGALSSFWAGGDGASHASISTAFALAGHVEPQENESLNKEQRVLRALRSTTGEPFMRLVEELVPLIRGALEDDASPQKGRTLRAAFERANSSLSPEGFVVWDSGVGGHEILPVGGHETARWWPVVLPIGGQWFCPR